MSRGAPLRPSAAGVVTGRANRVITVLLFQDRISDPATAARPPE
ncbi:hypothetical protein AB0H60_32980 [Nocardia rhamnosiphila]